MLLNCGSGSVLMIFAAVFKVLCSSQVAKPHCDTACQDTLNGTEIKVHKSFGAHTKPLKSPQKVQSLLCFLEDAIGVDRPCEGV